MSSITLSKLKTILVLLVSCLISFPALAEEKENPCKTEKKLVALLSYVDGISSVKPNVVGDNCYNKGSDDPAIGVISLKVAEITDLKKRKRAQDTINKTLGADIDDDDEESCKEAEKEFKTAKSTAKKDCSSAHMNCEEQFDDCQDALDELSDDGSMKDAISECKPLSKQGFKELKETYEDNRKERDDILEELADMKEEENKLNGDYATNQANLDKAIEDKDLELAKHLSDGDAAYRALDKAIRRKIQARDKRVKTIENQVDDLTRAYEMTKRNYHKEKRQISKRCWEFAEKEVTRLTNCQNSTRVQESRTGGKAIAQCKTNLSQANYVKEASKERSKRLLDSLDYYHQQCITGNASGIDKDDLKSDVEDQRDALKSKLDTLLVELEQALNEQIIGDSEDNDARQRAVREYELVKTKLKSDLKKLRQDRLNIQQSHSKAVLALQQRISQKTSLAAEFMQSFTEDEAFYRTVKSSAKNSSTKDNAVTTALASYQDAIDAAHSAYETCGCGPCNGGNTTGTIGSCPSANAFKGTKEGGAYAFDGSCPSNSDDDKPKNGAAKETGAGS